MKEARGLRAYVSHLLRWSLPMSLDRGASSRMANGLAHQLQKTDRENFPGRTGRTPASVSPF